jgi:fructose transport system permease protein
MKLPPFIVTLGMWQIVLATNFLYSANETIRARTSPTRRRCCSSSATRLRLEAPSSPMASIFMVLLVLLLAYVLKQTAWGRHVYAVGDDPEAAELAGVNVKRTLISVYMLSGLICAFAGWALIGRFGSVSPTSGQVGQHRIHHRRGDRRHLAVRRPRLDHGRSSAR